MKKRKIFASLILGSAALSLISCGPKDDDNKDGTQEVTSYTVTFANTDIASATTNDEGKITKPTDPTKEGFTFGGWYTDEACTVEFNFDSVLTENITIYAKWTEVEGSIEALLPNFNQANPIEMNGTKYDTIAAAIAAIPTSGDTSTYVIKLNKGTYNENGLAYNGSATIKLVGNTTTKYGADVIIKGHGSKMPGEQGASTKTRCLISIQGTGNIILENLTLESDWSRADHAGDVQAEVLGTDTTGNTAAYNCSFKSHQDTIRTAGKAWFYGCYVEGDVDFLWMESGGKVALYEECEIVSVYDEAAKTHNTYICAPRMAETVKAGKGLVIYNSEVKESEEAKANGQLTYLARTPWSSGYFNQVAYINSTVTDIELADGPWYKNQIETIYEKTTVGWKMDQATADSMGIEGEVDYIVDEDTVDTEFNGRRSIINRVFDTGKLKYASDGASKWDVDTLIRENGWEVTEDTSKEVLDGETSSEPVVYNFDGSEDQTALCSGFEKEEGKAHYRGQAGATITIPVNGKSYVEVYGYYSGTVLATTDGQGEAVMFFNNSSTSAQIENDYIVYNADAKSVVLTAQATTYITKIVVVGDSSIEYKKVEDLEITKSSPLEIVGVPVTLNATISPKGVTNSSVKWSSSNAEIATIEEYTGKVKFLEAGEVTFTATACDGSGVTKTITCNPTKPTWTQIEWYTTDKDITAETGADGIGMFDFNASTYKSLSKEYTFKNAAGETITTKCGYKLNSAGKLSFAILKYAEVTLIVAPQQNANVTPPQITTAEGGKAELLTQSVDESTGLQTFTYAVSAAGLWNIERGDTAMENNPLVYAKVEYKVAVIEEETGITFKGGTYTTNSTGVQNIVGSGYVDATDRTVEINKVSITNCVSNDTAGTNWLKFNSTTGSKIEFNVGRSFTLMVSYYQKTQKVLFNGTEVQGTVNANGLTEYYIPTEGVVTIEAIENDYIGFIGLVPAAGLDTFLNEAKTQLDTLYPAENYTNNPEYATVLAAQKAAIDAVTAKADIAAALEAAKTAMNAVKTNSQIAAETVVSVEVTNVPNVAVGSTADLSGIVVTATYADEHTAALDVSKYTLSAVDTTAAGEVTVTLTVTGTEVTKEFKVIVVEEIETYSITYNTAVGTAPAVVEDLTTIPAELPTLTDSEDLHEFDAWYLDAEFTTKAVSGTVLNEDITLYAHWFTVAELQVEAVASLDTLYPAANYVAYAEELTAAKTVAAEAINAATTVTAIYDALAAQKELLNEVISDAQIEAATITYSFVTLDTLENYVAPAENVKVYDKTTNTIEGLTLTSGSCAADAKGNSVQFKNNAVLTFDVKAGSAVTIEGFPGYSSYSINGRNASNTYTRYFAEDTTITLAVDKYLVSIKVNPLAKAVEEATIEKLEVNARNVEFNVGDEYEVGTLDVKTVYTDGSYVLLADTEYSVDSSAVDTSTVGEYDVIVKFGEYEAKYVVSVVNADDGFVSETVGFSFNGSKYTGENVINANNPTEGFKLENTSAVEYENVTFSGCVSNGTENWMKFNSSDSAAITFEVPRACIVKLAFYEDTNNATVTINGNEVATETVADGTKQGNVKYEYLITTAGTVTITANGNGYIGFVGVEIEPAVTQTIGFSFNGSKYTGENVLNANNPTEGFKLESTAEYVAENVTFNGCVSNGTDNWMKFRKDNSAVITFNISDPSTLKLAFYEDTNVATVALNGNEVTTETVADGTSQGNTKYEYVLTEAGTVTITANGNGYIGFIEVVCPKKVTKTVGFTFNSTKYTGENVLNANNPTEGFKLESTAEYVAENVTFNGCVSNGTDNWMKFRKDNSAVITFNTYKPCTLKIAFYEDTNIATVALNGNEVTTETVADGTNQGNTKYEYVLTEAGTVTITANGNGYIGFIEIVYA